MSSTSRQIREPGAGRGPEALTPRIEAAIAAALAALDDPTVPPQLRAAMHHAVFPGGGRIRPRLGLAVAVACGDDDPRLADAAAAAVELLHCASLVHDDLPVFDDAPIRRGRASVHAAFGEQLAVLAGDGLIVLAFETLARAGTSGSRLAQVVSVIARGAGAHCGIVSGQAWESEPQVNLAAYHHAKTAALFEAVVEAGAIAGGGNADDWRPLGRNFGAAYQLADDVADWLGDSAALGKPVGQDAARGRPNALDRLGREQAEAELAKTMQAALAAIPPCEDAAVLEGWVARALQRLLPKANLVDVCAGDATRALSDADSSGEAQG